MANLPPPPPPSEDPLYLDYLLSIYQEGIDDHPRSAQRLIGPSEIGGCERKIGFKLAYGSTMAQEPGGWAAHVGTTQHAWADWWWRKKMKRGELRMPDGSERFLSDVKVDQIVPWVAGGTIDLFDKLLGRVIDWKHPGQSTGKKVKAGYVSPGYYAQAMTYGLGLQRMGYVVNDVALCFIAVGADGIKKQATFKVWPFDPAVAWDRLRNIYVIEKRLKTEPVRSVLESLETQNDFCQGCPALIGNGDRRAMCPGATATNKVVDRDANPFAR